uniref:Activating molecule in BECN1-regulated autophagy protein 1 n=1 Tax=Aceria tosichella TaxID=561515 RepID=A0A6G1S361_9ACAR
MASNYTHQSSVEEPLERFVSTLPENVMQHIQDEIGDPEALVGKDPVQPCRSRLASGISRPISSTSNNNYKKLNDFQLIRHRHVRFDHNIRKQLELLCEDKVSRYKFEEVHCSLPSSVKSTFIMTFSPDGQRVASTHGDHRIYICDLNTGKLLDTLEGHPKTPWCLAWHPSNREILASGCLAGEVRVWDLRSKACESWTSENHTIITSLDFHPKERVLVIATANDVHFWDWSESEPFAKTSTMHDREKVKFVVFDSSGTKLITGISNLPKFSGYSNDSLQNRIIDGYLSQGSIEPLQTDNMTQTSEITTSPFNDTVNTNENLGSESESSLNSATSSGHGRSNSNNINYANSAAVNGSEHYEISHRNTILLSRVASLYRHLEALEDSIRHTSFTPFLNYQQQDVASSRAEHANRSSLDTHHDQNCQSHSGSVSNSRSAQQAESSELAGSAQDVLNHLPPSTSTPTLNTFEPYLVTFDESLEQLQLPPLVIDGQAVNLASVIDRYPVDLSRQLYHAMQFESINQVSQNFIRISKLMSSARLYRQVVQQIVTSNSNNGILQPNQLLTAQSVTPRSPRNSPNLPIVLRNLSVGGNPLENRSSRQHHHDPILAIEFRNSARNVPLATICKIDLLAARAICILRSQTLVEQALANVRPPLPQNEDTAGEASVGQGALRENESAARPRGGAPNQSIQSIIGQLHSTLTMINHAPLTTSNAYTHITSLRVLIEKLHKTFSSMLGSATDGNRLSELMHKIALSLTGRSWNVPLGATLDEIRLDVIQTLCIVDLTLHLTRQIQLLQMQRISVITRIEESRRPATKTKPTRDATERRTVSSEGESSNQPSSSASNSVLDEPGTSTDCCNVSKRKSSSSLMEDTNKRQKIEASKTAEQLNVGMETENTRQQTSAQIRQTPQTEPTSTDQSAPVDRMILWNSPQSQIEQSLQRFFVATSSSMNNSHILVRFYHRLPGMQSVYPFHGSGVLESSMEHRINPQTESRRRALSQDNSVNAQESIDTAGSAEAPPARVRVSVRPPAPAQVNIIPSSSNYNGSNNTAYDAWQRHPHLHVYQTRGTGPHLWFNQWTIPLPVNSSNYRLQCWNFSRESIPTIGDSQVNIITQKCRIHNDSSIDISSDGNSLACLVPKDDGPACFPSFDLKIFSLRSYDFGSCYYKLPQGPNAVSVSLSPSGTYAVVGLASHKVMSYDQGDDNLTIGKIFKITQKNSFEFLRDIKIKRDDSSLSLNAIKWMQRGIVYNVGPQHHQRYQTARMRNVVAS